MLPEREADINSDGTRHSSSSLYSAHGRVFIYGSERFCGHFYYDICLHVASDGAGLPASVSTVASKSNAITVRKRYTDFLNLHECVVAQLPASAKCADLVLPRKSRSGLNIRMKSSSNFARRRQEALQRYLVALLSLDPQLECECVREFFGLPVFTSKADFKVALESIMLCLRQAAALFHEDENEMIAIAGDWQQLFAASVLYASHSEIWAKRYPQELSREALAVKERTSDQAQEKLMEFIRHPTMKDLYGDS